mmetsp:Transcript_7801/g.22305  ORF Transcript_7801/g.22305 Transcript_7801/m.22305 type:complete len:275 (-) Transcript_7801:32-856(-)
MLLHHSDKDVLGQLEEVLVKTPQDGARILHQVGHLRKKPFLHALRDLPPAGPCKVLGVIPYHALPLFHVHHDAVALHLREVARGSWNVDGRDVEAVPQAKRDSAACDSAGREGDHLAPVDGNNPPQGTGVGGLGVPSHALLELQLADDVGQPRREQLAGHLTLHFLRHPAVFRALLVRFQLYVLNAHSVLLAVAKNRLGWIALAIKGNARRRPSHLLHSVLLLGSQVLYDHEDSSWRPRRHNLVVVQVQVAQELGKLGDDLFADTGDLVCGQLF